MENAVVAVFGSGVDWGNPFRQRVIGFEKMVGGIKGPTVIFLEAVAAGPGVGADVFMSPGVFLSVGRCVVGLGFSVLAVLLFFLSTSFPLTTRGTPRPFSVSAPSLHIFLPTPRLTANHTVMTYPNNKCNKLTIGRRNCS